MPRYYNDELYHFGIPGMKWGVRRFETKDGKLTPLGKERYSKKDPTHDDLMKSTNATEVYKYRDQLTDQELKNRVNRIQTEQQLKQLTKKEMTVGQEFLDRLGMALMAGTVAAVSGAIIADGKAAIGNMNTGATISSVPTSHNTRSFDQMNDYERKFYGK